jgi:hypothetical protein
MRTYAAHQADPERFAARPATHGTHRLTLAPRLDLEFDGATLDYDVFTQSAPADPALQAHQSVWALFHAGQIKPFSDRHDARSRKKLEGWHAARARQMRSWWAYVRQGRRAAFWMRGQDFALVFAAEGPPTAKRLMRWDWMQRTPTGWRPIKFGRFDAVDVALLSILPATEAEFDAAMGRTRR